MIQLKYRLFGVPLVFFLVQVCIVDHFLRGYLFLRYLEQGYFIVQLLQYFISPALLFLVSYSLGKRVNLQEELLVVVYSLFSGSLIGSLFLLGFQLAVSDPAEIHDLYLYAVSSSFHVFQGLQTFFVCFTAVAIASLRSPKHVR